MARDNRSVGELLAEADQLTRQLLMDVRGDDAPAMLRTWGEVVESAAEVWNAIPGPSPHAEEQPGGELDPLRRLLPAAHALHRYQLKHHWPGEGPTDDRLLRVAALFTRAGDLVDRFGGDIRPTRPEVRADLEAARMRIMHAVYVAAHGVATATRDHLADLEREKGPRGWKDNCRGVLHGNVALDRLAVSERLASGWIGNRYAAAVAGEADAEPERPHTRLRRLAEALTAWDVQAHRSLTGSPNGPNLVLTTRTQATIASTAAAVLHAASLTGHNDVTAFRQRVRPALDATQQVWTQAAGRWADLAVPGARTDPDLVHAAGELLAAIRDTAHDHTTWARPEVMAGRVDLTKAVQVMQQAIASSVEVAHLTREIAAHDDTLAAPARLMSTRAQQATGLAAPAGPTTTTGRDPVWVDPGAVHRNAMVPLPTPVRDALVASGSAAVQACTRAMSTTNALDIPGRPHCLAPGEVVKHAPTRLPSAVPEPEPFPSSHTAGPTR